jgi:PAS domain S-box-containing protein
MPSPGQRNIQQYLRTNLIAFIVIIVLIVILAAFTTISFFSARQVFTEIVDQANTASSHLAAYQSDLEHFILLFEDRDESLDGSEEGSSDSGHQSKNNDFYNQIIIVDDQHNIVDSFPPANPETSLTDQELNAVIVGDNKGLIPSFGPEGEPGLSIVTPVTGIDGPTDEALIGRVNGSSLANSLIVSLGNDPGITGAVIDSDDRPIIKIGTKNIIWSGIENPLLDMVLSEDDSNGKTRLGQDDRGVPQLIYLPPSINQNLQLGVSYPLTTILKPGLIGAGVLGSVLLVVAGFFYSSMNTYGQELSQSISGLTQDSRKFTADTTLSLRGDDGRQDELGELSQAMGELQRVLKNRLDEQSLMLSISQETSTSFELSESLPVVLHGALRGTGGAGIRILVLNPGGGNPVSYSEGPAAQSMQLFDSKLLSLMRRQEELSLSSQQAIYETLEIDPSTPLAIKALYALPLGVEKKFLGLMVVGFRDEREFTENDATFLQFLAGRASILVQKSFLYTYAEGGRKRLMAVLDSTSEAVIVTDPTARILRVNRALERSFDLVGQRITGRKVADVIDSPELVTALTSEETDSRDLEIQGKDGCTYFANTSLIISHDGKALGRVAVLHDVTHLKEIDRLKSEFIDNVSHDLRSPLTVLSGYASALALADDLTEEQREYTDNILHSVERMVELVEDVLDLGRIEAGVDLVFEHIHIGRLLQDLADEHWLYAHESGIRLRVRAADNLPLVYCDRRLLKRALSNILMNGFKYAPNSEKMVLAAELAEDAMLISVQDRGPGIAREDQLRLFEKFYRVKRHGAGAVKGTGLGLAMVKSIAEKHGGRTWCESAAGKGSTFYIALPLKEGTPL